VGCHPGLDEPRLAYLAEQITAFCEARGVAIADPRFVGKRVLVTGGSGFVGSAIVRRLAASGADVASLSRSGNAPEGVTGIAADIAKAADVSQALAQFRPSIVIHATAAGTAGTASVEEMIQTNVLGTQSVLEACRAHRPESLIVLGSWTEYGPMPEGVAAVTEDAPTQPASTYGVTKRTATMLTRAWAAEHRIPTTILRLASVFGPGEAAHRLLPTLAQAAKTAIAPSLGDPETVRDFIHVEDVVDAILEAALHPSHGATYNVGSGEGRSVRELVDLFRATHHAFPEPHWSSHAPRPWDIPRWVADVTAIQAALHWKPRRSIQASISSLL